VAMTLSRKILIVAPAGLVGGKEVISLTLARGLRDEGWEPEFITSRWNNGEFVRQLEREEFAYHLLWLGFIAASLRPRVLRMTLDQLVHWPSLARRYTQVVAEAAPAAVIHTNWHHAVLLLPFLNPDRDIYWAHDSMTYSMRRGAM